MMGFSAGPSARFAQAAASNVSKQASWMGHIRGKGHHAKFASYSIRVGSFFWFLHGKKGGFCTSQVVDFFIFTDARCC